MIRRSFFPYFAFLLALPGAACQSAKATSEANIFPNLKEIDGVTQFPDLARQLEGEGLTPLHEIFSVQTRRFFLVPHNTFAAVISGVDNYARSWQGERRAIRGKQGERVSKRLALWVNPQGRAEAVTMSNEPVDTQGHYLVGYFTLTRTKP